MISTQIELNAAVDELTYLTQGLAEVTMGSPNSLTVVSIKRMMSRIEQEIAEFQPNTQLLPSKEESRISGTD